MTKDLSFISLISLWINALSGLCRQCLHGRPVIFIVLLTALSTVCQGAERVLVQSDHILPRTAKLIRQKVTSLKRYNKEMSAPTILEFYQRLGVALQPEGFEALREILSTQLIPTLWFAAQQKRPQERFVSPAAMTIAMEEAFPQALLPNGDVLLLPDSLRLLVTEPDQDFFRDSGLHWLWIGRAIEAFNPQQKRELHELDPYAAELLSEFVSVMGVAVVQLVGRKTLQAPSPSVTTLPLGHGAIVRSAYETLHQATQSVQPSAAPDRVTAPTVYSDKRKEQLLRNLPKPMFIDVTRELGLNFTHEIDLHLRLRAGAPNTLGIAGGGVAAEDIDGDGYPDLFFAGAGGGRLYRNVQGKYFQDVTQEVGLNLNGESRAAYFIDYDNDGDQDLFITFVDVSNRLFEQRRGVFVDVTKKVGLDTRGLITHEAVFFDMDRDGLLDLYTAQFGAWHEGLGPTFGRSNNNGLPNRLYKHTFRQGKHRFENKARAAGVADTGWTHCVGVLDYDQDGYPDLFSLNDFGVSRVYHNLGDGRFEDASTAMHFDTSYHAMNFTLLDVNQDGYFEFYVSEITNLMHRQRYRRPTQNTAIVFTKENLANLRILVNNKLYQRTGKGHFEDVHGRIFEPASLGWAWGVSAFDYENDGDPDLLILNGTESEEVLQFETLLSQFSGTQNVFYMSEEGYFYDVSERAPLAFSGDSRSSAVFDFDLDGDLDVVINNYGRPAQIFRNEQQSANRWIRLRLRGASSNQDAIGARVQLTAGDRVQHGVVVAGSGFLSQDPKLLHFGLGRWQGLVDIRVVWPSGQVQHFKNRTPNRMHTLVELQ